MSFRLWLLGGKNQSLAGRCCQRWAEIVLKLKVIFCYDISEHRGEKRAKYNRSDCAEDPFRGTDTEGVMSAVHHLGGMLNALVLIDTLDSLVRSHAQTHTCNL